MTYLQAPPFSVQIEPTEGCNLRCGFCGIRGIREKGTSGDLSGPYNYMTVGTATGVARQMAELGWNARLEFAMHGEPTLNPALPSLIATFRTHLPGASIMLTTNGIPLLDGPWGTGDLRGALVGLLGAGVNTIAIDDYAPHRVVPAVRALQLPCQVLDYPQDGTANPHRRYFGQRVVVIQDIAQSTEGTHARLLNHAGSAAPLDHAMDAKTCSLPFREMAVRWDGEVALCCNDWRGQYRLGNAAEDLLGTWHSRAAYAARRLLMNEGRADITPCSGCDYRPTRPGLLPQPNGKGKEELGVPTADDRVLVAAQAVAPTAAPVVLRRWERDA